MIAKEALNLVKRLNDLKNSENKDSKSLKSFLHSIADYQTKAKKDLGDLNEKISYVEDELKIIRDYERSQQQAAVKKVDQFEQSLKNLLSSYQSEANEANKKLESMVETIKQELKTSFKESLKIQKSGLNRMQNINDSLESLIQMARNQQKSSIDSYQKLRGTIRERSNDLIKAHHRNSQQIIKWSQRLMSKIDELQSKLNNQIDIFYLKKQSKMYEAHQTLHLMIQRATDV